MTLGQKLMIREDEYPLTLYFGDFYYYENINGHHLLMHIPTRKSTENFKISHKINIMKQINLVFDLNIEELKIYDPAGKEMLFHGTKEYSSTVTQRMFDGDSSVGVGKFQMECTFILYGLPIPPDKDVNGRVYTKKSFQKAVKEWMGKYTAGEQPIIGLNHKAREEIPP